MGRAIDREEFEEADYAAFSRKLKESLPVMDEVLSREGFGEGPRTIGAELELFLTDEDGDALPAGAEVLRALRDERMTHELDRFNLEVNASPELLAGRPFSALHGELAQALRKVERTAKPLGAFPAVIGILPTLTADQLGKGALTDTMRYRALMAGLRKCRGNAPFHIDIDGDEPLLLDFDEGTLQGANTSFQLHLRSSAREFATLFNAAQLATPVVLAISGNSPTFLGHRLWAETRIALFKQAGDDRMDGPQKFKPASRVSFGHGWLRGNPADCFRESVALYPPLLPCLDDAGPDQGSSPPPLSELRLHHGTVWSWNRAVYDPSQDGHLRIEFRALPAGPTVVDMVASGAFLLGLTLGLAEEVERLLPAMPFDHAERNFYRAAKHGVRSTLLWPGEPPSPRAVPALKLAQRLLPIAERGLLDAGVDSSEVSAQLGVIQDRIDAGASGAVWQRSVLDRLVTKYPRPEALSLMLRLYRDNAATGAPVHRWSGADG